MNQFYSLKTSGRILAFTIIGLVSFTIANAQPVVSSFSPVSGPVGTNVIITGTGFNATPANNTVYFGAAKANVSAASATSLTVQVPSGATNEPFTVTTVNLTAYSAKPFHITFNGGTLSGSSFTRADFNCGLGADEMALCDFDLDGKNDVVTIGVTNRIFFIRNTSSSGTVSFAPYVEFAVTGNFEHVAAADFNGDGKQDIVLIDESAGFTILKNTSTAGTITFNSVLTSAVSSYPGGVRIADIDRDGRPDLIMSTLNFVPGGGIRLSIFRNTSTGGTISFAPVVNIPDVANTSSLEFTVADLDIDSKPDLVVFLNSATANPLVKTFRNLSTTGSISFSSGVDFSLGTYCIGYSVDAADIDGDDKPELIVTDFDEINILRNTGTSGTISFAPVIMRNLAGTQNWNSTNAYVTDMNGDGKKDLVFSDVTEDIVGILPNTGSVGNISFGAIVELPVVDDPLNLIAADMNGDGKPDIITSNLSTTTGVSVFTNTTAVLPVGILSFNLQQKEGKIFLQWSTATEKNTDAFVVEHSLNGIEFTGVGSVKASFNSNVKKEYSFLHNKPAAGWNYYRLKMVDVDGKFSYSSTIRVKLDEAAIKLRVYPNPSDNISVIEHPAVQSGYIVVSDISGKVIRKINAKQNAHQTLLDTKDLVPGVYTVTWISDGQKSSTSLIIK
jgi:hypothetical protein